MANESNKIGHKGKDITKLHNIFPIAYAKAPYEKFQQTSPGFVKAAAIIPRQPPMIYVGEKPVDVITLEIFPGPKFSFDMYEDDGTSLP